MVENEENNMASYVQNSTSPDTFSLEIGDYTQTTDTNFSKKNPSANVYAPTNEEFNFMHATTARGMQPMHSYRFNTNS